VSYFTLRTIIILMETIKDLYQTPTPSPPIRGGVGGIHRTQFIENKKENPKRLARFSVSVGWNVGTDGKAEIA
jgi:hypothetical protein